MAYICVLYASTEGQTRKVAEVVADRLGKLGHRVTVDPVDNRFQFGHCSAVVIGASIHVGSFSGELKRFIERHRELLAKRPTAFFSVSLTAAKDDAESRETVQGYHHDLRSATGWTPALEAAFAGALKFSRYNFLKRMFMQKIAQDGGLTTDTKQDHEFTDWGAVDAFAKAVSDLLADPPSSSRRSSPTPG